MTCHTDNCKATGGFGFGLGLRRGCGAPAGLRDFNSGSPLHPAAAGQGSPPHDARRPQHARPALAERAPCPAPVPPPRNSRILQVLLQGGLHPRPPPSSRPGSRTSSPPSPPQARSASRSHDPRRARRGTAPPKGQTSSGNLRVVFGAVRAAPSRSRLARVIAAGGEACGGAAGPRFRPGPVSQRCQPLDSHSTDSETFRPDLVCVLQSPGGSDRVRSRRCGGDGERRGTLAPGCTGVWGR